MPEPLQLCPVSPSGKERLWSLLQECLTELSSHYGDSADDQGHFPYPYFEDYFSQPSRRAYFLVQGGRSVGFALLNQHSPLGRNPDWAMAEFYISPAHRRMGLARQAAALLFQSHPGRWELKFSRENTAARRFWLSVTGAFSPELVPLSGREEALSFTAT